MVIKTIIVLAVVGSIIFILYSNGYIMLQNKKALMFVGKNNFSDKRCSARFSACTGRFKRVIRLKENRTYTFSLNCAIDNGEAKFTIKNSDKKDILVLDAENNTGTVDAVNEKFFLEIELYKAYGRYELSWK